MDRIRAFLRDRLAGGTVAAWLAYALLLQALLGGMAQAAMMRPTAGILCTPAGLAAGPDGPALPDAAAHACCPAICQAAAGGAGPLPEAGTAPPPPHAAAMAAARPAETGTLPRQRPSLLPGPRAPPGPALHRT